MGLLALGSTCSVLSLVPQNSDPGVSARAGLLKCIRLCVHKDALPAGLDFPTYPVYIT